MDEYTQKRQFEQWLPFYVNGRLGESETSWMKQYLKNHPEANADLDYEHAFKESLQTGLPDWAPNHGLDTLMNRIRSEQRSAVKATNETALPWLTRLQAALSHAVENPRWAAAVALLLVQTGIIGMLVSHRTAPDLTKYSAWRSVGQTAAYKGPVLQISFKSSATEAEIRLLMIQIRGVFLGGPGQLGNYIVRVAPEQIEAAEKQVMDSDIIEAVQVLPEMPVEP